MGDKTIKYCVIGGAGFIGSHIVDELISRGNDVLVLDNLVSGEMENVNSKAEFTYLDVTQDKGRLIDILINREIDYVFHLAAEPFIPDCYEHPELFFDVNAKGTMNVLLACKKAMVKKIVYFSTSEVYGTVSGKISENTRLNPQSTYAVSKLAGDRLCLTLFKEQSVPVVILRQFNCYGERETHDYIIPTLITQLSKNSVLKLGNIKSKRDFTYVKDGAKTACDLMEKGVPGEVYNSGSGSCMSVEEIADILCKKMRNEAPTFLLDQSKMRPFDVERLECDNKKILEIVGKYNTPFDKGLQNTIDWFYAHNRRWGFEK